MEQVSCAKQLPFLFLFWALQACVYESYTDALISHMQLKVPCTEASCAKWSNSTSKMLCYETCFGRLRRHASAWVSLLRLQKIESTLKQNKSIRSTQNLRPCEIFSKLLNGCRWENDDNDWQCNCWTLGNQMTMWWKRWGCCETKRAKHEWRIPKAVQNMLLVLSVHLAQLASALPTLDCKWEMASVLDLCMQASRPENRNVWNWWQNTCD